METFGHIVFVIFATCCLANTSTAQNSSARPISASDTLAWRQIFTYVVQSMAPYVARSLRDTISRPWAIEVPESAPMALQFKDRMRMMLRARAVQASDSEFYHLRIDTLRINGDTIRLHVVSGFTQVCRDLHVNAGYANVDEVYLWRIVRDGLRFWSAARSRGVDHGDAPSCDVRRRHPRGREVST